MSNRTKPFTLVMIIVLMGSAMIPIASMDQPTLPIQIADSPSTVAATTLLVTNETFNSNQEFNDDDYIFHVYNTTTDSIIAGAVVTLYNATNSSAIVYYDDFTTIGDGSAPFYNVPQGIYIWNVTWSEAPDVFTTGYLRSDGPEAFVTTLLGNLDSHNDDDDLNVTVIDIDDSPAEGLNFTVYSRDTNTTYNETILGVYGNASLLDIPVGNYTYYVTVVTGVYAGTVIAQDDFVTDGTLKLVHQSIGPFAGDPDYYDIEVFTYYETSLAPLSGALVNVTYINGTVIEAVTTPANGTVQIIDLPVVFINWTIMYSGETLGTYTYNLTDVSADVRDPIITSPGDVEFLFDAEKILLNWTFQEEHPSQFKIYVDGSLNATVSWVNTTQEYTFNATGNAIGIYEIRVEATDLNGNTAEETVELRIYEDIVPVIEGSDDVEYVFTQTGHSVRWNVTDDFMNMYSIERNGTSVRNGTLDPDAPFVTISVDDLGIGIHIYAFMANDTSGNESFDNITVTVLRDSVSPVFSFTPSTIYYERGAINLVFNWTVTDEFMDTYTIKVDGFVIEEGDWTEDNIEFDFSGLAEGTHYVTLMVYDLGGNSASSSVAVIVSPPGAVKYGIVVGVILAGLVIAGLVLWYIRNR